MVDIDIRDAIERYEDRIRGFRESESYYNADPRDFAIGVATPPQLRDLLAQIGVPRIYVQAIAERLIIEGFRIGDAGQTDEELLAWFRANRLDIFSQTAFVDTLVYGRSYITIAAPGEDAEEHPMSIPDVPVIKVESPKSLYAEVDPRTGDVEWAVRVIKDETGEVVSATLYTPDATTFYEPGDYGLRQSGVVNHGLGVVPVVPMIRPASTDDLYGTSIITPEIKSITDAMSRAMMNMQTTSELMATPQRIIFGSSTEEINGDNKSGLELYTSSYLVCEDPAGKAIQLPAAELRNFTEAISHMLKMAAAYTGLPPQYLSYANDNPSSAEAIRSSEARLVRTCESLATFFGDAWERAMRVAMLVMGRELTLDVFRMETVFRDPATPTYQAKADASTKLYANGKGPIPKEQVRIDMGYSPEQRRQMEEWDKQGELSQLESMYASFDEGVSEDPAVEDGADSGDER